MENYFSVCNPLAQAKVEGTLNDEIAQGNYMVVSQKPTIVSALGAVPKPDSSDLRIIHDCSMPRGLGVNSYIDIEKQQFSTVDEAVRLVEKGCFMAKVDLRHAYRSVPVHPSNFEALGLKWRFQGDENFTYLVDTRLPFGAKSSPGIFHRLTQAVKRMMIKRGFSLIIVYLDDFLVLGHTLEECQLAYDTLCNLLVGLGFELSPSKLVPPTQRLVFLGVEFDSCALTLSLPTSKLKDFKAVILSFQQKRRVSKRQLQCLAGKLNWACKVVYGGRTFLRRILDLMNSLPSSHSRCRLTKDFHADLQWWSMFLDTFNGKCNFLDPRPLTSLQTDACDVALGAAFESDWFYCNFFVDFPALTSLHINYKEAICIVLSALRWAHCWRNKKVHIFCDNTAAVAMLNKGTTKSPFMMSYLRLLFWLSAVHNFRLQVFHIPGVSNCYADHISRLHEGCHLSGFLELAPSFGTNPAVVNCFHHMSPLAYYLLLGSYSSPLD